MKRKVLITGGLGFIGVHCVERWKDEGWDICVVDNKSANTVDSLFDGVEIIESNLLDLDWKDLPKVDLVLHLAAPVGPVGVLKHSGTMAKLILEDIYWAIEGAKYNIKANVLAPNATTRMTEELFGEEFAKLFQVEQVTPLVVYLASETCDTTHEIFSAGAGRYARIGIDTHKGYVNPTATADDISENIEEIRTIKDGTYPMNNADEFMIIQQALQGE